MEMETSQGILGNDSVRIVDYSALYDGVIRTRLWVEVSRCGCKGGGGKQTQTSDWSTESYSMVSRILQGYIGPPVLPMESLLTTVLGDYIFRDGVMCQTSAMEIFTGK